MIVLIPLRAVSKAAGDRPFMSQGVKQSEMGSGRAEVDLFGDDDRLSLVDDITACS
jgi:hypothetical protein